MNRKIWALCLDINEVVYIRRNGKVIAAKYLGLESRSNGCGDITKHLFLRADGIKEDIAYTYGHLLNPRTFVYETIEDAIHEVGNMPYRLLDITNILIDRFGFSHGCNVWGGKMLRKKMWKWDGYRAKECNIHHFDYNVRWDGEWHCECSKNLEQYYDTEEECRRENHVDVITF